MVTAGIHHSDAHFSSYACRGYCSFWPLLSLGEIRESNYDFGVITRHTLIVRGGANIPHIRRTWQKGKTGFSKLVLANTKTQNLWSTGPTALLHYPRLDTIFLQHKNIRHKKSTLTFISTIYLSQALAKNQHNCFHNSGNVTTNLCH